MKFSAQEEFGLRCLLQLARAESNGLTIPEISRLESLSQPHVAKLMSILRKEGFVKSTRGHIGGYTLARPANEIHIAHVLEGLGGRLYDDEFCGRHTGHLPICTHAVDCSVRSLWQVIQDAVDSALRDLTLGQMLEAKTNVTLFDAPRRVVEVS
jgi:Rrf2 family protein